MKQFKKLDLFMTRFAAESSDKTYNVMRRIRVTLDLLLLTKDRIFKKDYILIYQQGRVASTSVYESLTLLNLRQRLYHVHLLSAEKADKKIIAANKKKQKVPRYLYTGKYLAESFSKDKEKNWHIITIFREPISMLLSVYFLNAERAFKHVNFDQEDELVKAEMIKEFKAVCENDDPDNWDICNWYDDIFKNEIGIDVFDFEFNKERNYLVISQENVQSLLLKFESLKDNFSYACSDFLDIKEADELTLLNSNVHKNNKLSNHHQYIKNNLSLSIDALDRIYNTKFVKHFYSEKEIENFKEKWGRKH